MRKKRGEHAPEKLAELNKASAEIMNKPLSIPQTELPGVVTESVKPPLKEPELPAAPGTADIAAGLVAGHMRALAVEIIRATVAVGERYLDLCRYIRKQKVDPVTVRAELSKCGFAKQRITEINRVSQVPDNVWSEYEAKALSFRGALELARGNVEHLKLSEPSIDVSSVVKPDEEAAAADAKKDGATDSEPAPEVDNEQSSMTAMTNAAKKIMKLADNCDIRGKTWRSEFWQVKLSKVTSPKGKGRRNAAKEDNG